MPLQLPGAGLVTGGQYREQQREKAKESNLAVVTSRGRRPNNDPAATFVVPEKVWGPANESGARYLLHAKGDKITEARAIELGLLEAPTVKKAPAPENKKRSVSSKRAATETPATPSDS